MSPLQIFVRKKQNRIPITMIALSDAPAAQIACDSGIDALLVGDSLGNTALGFHSTISVTMDMMAHHLSAVVRGVKSSSRPDVPIIADMPFGSYATPEVGVQNAVRLMQLGAHAVKIEGTQDTIFHGISTVFELCRMAGSPVVGHIGFTPQSELQFQSVVQGKTADAAVELLRQALFLQKSGCFALVLEAMTAGAAHQITSMLTIPTIGIGAGKNCNGQVLVWHDLVGITEKPFKMARAFASTRAVWTDAIRSYCSEVESAQFPTAQNGWEMSVEEQVGWEEALIQNFPGDESDYPGPTNNQLNPNPVVDEKTETSVAVKLDEQPF